MSDLRRADARRNYFRILEAARTEVAVVGARASFEKIARDAGVGSATVHRHFPSREALLYAVFHQRIEELRELAENLALETSHGQALQTFLDAVLVYCVDARGLAITLVLDYSAAEDDGAKSCSQELEAVVRPLLARAAEQGFVRVGIEAGDLLALIVGIALATETHREPLHEGRRLLALAASGIRAPRCS